MPRSDDAPLPTAATGGPNWAIHRVRNPLYWQAGYGLFRAITGLLVVWLAAGGLTTSMVSLVAVTVIALGLALAIASVVLARMVMTRRRSVLMVIIGLEAVLCAVFGLPTLRAIVGLFTGGGPAGIVQNAFGLYIAVIVLRHACGSAARDWFNAP